MYILFVNNNINTVEIFNRDYGKKLQEINVFVHYMKHLFLVVLIKVIINIIIHIVK